jgi:hypothetical protein
MILGLFATTRSEVTIPFFEKPVDKYMTPFQFLRNGLEIGEGASTSPFSETESKVFG